MEEAIRVHDRASWVLRGDLARCNGSLAAAAADEDCPLSAELLDTLDREKLRIEEMKLTGRRGGGGGDHHDHRHRWGGGGHHYGSPPLQPLLPRPASPPAAAPVGPASVLIATA